MSIIDEKNEVKGLFWKPKTIGDKIEGTLVGIRQVPDKFNAGKKQNVFDIKATGNMTTDGESVDVDGDVVAVFSKPLIDAQMRYVNIGQIIGFKFTEILEPTQPGRNATNKVQVYADKKVIDEEWLKQQDELETIQGEGQPEQSLEDLVKTVNNLAIKKLGATTPEEIKEKVSAETGFAFVEANLAEIAAKLETLPDKQ